MVFSWNINLPSFPGISSSSIDSWTQNIHCCRGGMASGCSCLLSVKKWMIVCVVVVLVGEGNGSNQRFGRCRMLQVLRSDDTAWSPG